MEDKLILFCYNSFFTYRENDKKYESLLSVGNTLTKSNYSWLCETKENTIDLIISIKQIKEISIIDNQIVHNYEIINTKKSFFKKNPELITKDLFKNNVLNVKKTQKNKLIEVDFWFKNLLFIPIYETDFVIVFGGAKLDKVSKNYINTAYHILRNKIYEKELINEIKVKKIEKLKKEFMVNVSHEIRTPLTSIIGISRLLKQDSDLKPEIISKINIILDQSVILLSILNNILDMVKLQTNRLKVNYSPVSLIENIEQSKNACNFLLNQKKIKFSINTQNDFPKLIYTDETKIRQIILNLINNSTKFTETGNINVILSYIIREKDEYDNEIKIKNPNIGKTIYAIIDIKDTGPGIEEKIKKLINSDTNFKSFKKFGIGLSLCIGYIQLLKGQIREISHESGAHFQIKIPTYVYNEKMMLSIKDIENKKVLIIDDNYDSVLILISYLEKLKLNVTTCDNINLALNIYINNKVYFDFFILDYVIPNYDIKKLILDIKNKYPKTPFIITSSVDLDLTEFYYKNIPIIQKPYNINDIKNAILNLKFNKKNKKFKIDRKLRILVVNDIISEQNIIYDLLIKLKLKYFDFCKNAIQMINVLKEYHIINKKIKKCPYDVILMDITLPYLSGDKASLQINDIYSINYRPKIVALTANTLTEYINNLIKNGLDDYIVKPIYDKKQISEKLSQYNHRRRKKKFINLF